MSDTLKNKLEQIQTEKTTKLISSNIKKNVEILGVTGTLEEGIDTSDANANANDILTGKTAYKNNTKITGTMNNLGDLNIIPNLSGGTIGSGFVNSINISAVNASIDPNITASNIANGVNILGIIGNYEGSGGSGIDIPNWNSSSMLTKTITRIQSVNINDIGNYYMLQNNTTSIIVNNCINSLYLENIQSINADNFDNIYINATSQSTNLNLTEIYINNLYNSKIMSNVFYYNCKVKNCYIGNIYNSELYLNNCPSLNNLHFGLIDNSVIDINWSNMGGDLILNTDGKVSIYASNCRNINNIIFNSVNISNNSLYRFSFCTNLKTIDFNGALITLDGDYINDSKLFSYCNNLKTINAAFINFVTSGNGSTSLIDLDNAAGTVNMFLCCNNLINIPQFYLGEYTCTGYATDWGMGLELGVSPVCRDMFYSCNNLSNEALNNIALSLNNTNTGPLCYEENGEPAMSYNFSIGDVYLYKSNMETMENEFMCKFGLGLNPNQVNYISNLPIWSDLSAKGWSNRVGDIYL